MMAGRSKIETYQFTFENTHHINLLLFFQNLNYLGQVETKIEITFYVILLRGCLKMTLLSLHQYILYVCRFSCSSHIVVLIIHQSLPHPAPLIGNTYWMDSGQETGGWPIPVQSTEVIDYTGFS